MRLVGHGVVEGFYGPPWSFDARERMVRFLGDVGLETYAYAPKSDSLHRARWAEPLPRPDLAAFERLAEVARERSVRFFYGISPERLFGGGANLRVRRPADLDRAPMRALVDRCRSLAVRGITAFLLCFDDTWPTLFPRLASRALGLAHAAVATELARRLADAGTPVHVAVVPAIYAGRAPRHSAGARAYLEGIGTARVPVGWTGSAIFSRYVSRRDVLAHQRLVGAPLFVWSNAIANDWLPLTTGETVGRRGAQHLSFGPADTIDGAAAHATEGVLLNGAREPELTKIAAAALAEKLAARRLDTSAIAAVFGPRAAPLVTAIASIVGGHPLVAPHVHGAALLLDLAARARRGSLEARAALAAELASLVGLEARLVAALQGHPGLDELRPTAHKIDLAARALSSALASPSTARAQAQQAAEIRWRTGLDPALERARRGRFP